MKTIKIFFVLFAFAIFVACASNQPATNTPAANTAVSTASPAAQNLNQAEAPKDELAAARSNFTKYCVRCHQENGEGGKNIQIGDLTIKHVPNFKNPKVAAEPDAEYIEKIENGDNDGMPKFKDKLSPDEIKNLVRFIRKEFQGK